MNLMQQSLKAVMMSLVVLPFLITSCGKDQEEDMVSCGDNQVKCILVYKTDTCCPESKPVFATMGKHV